MHKKIAQCMTLWAVTILVCACTSQLPITDASAEAMKTSESSLFNIGIRTVDIHEASNETSNALISFFIENTTGEKQELLVWNTPFEKILSADIFNVSRLGASIDYAGRKVKRGEPTADQFIVVEPNSRREVSLDIALYYDLKDSGEYKVDLQPSSINGVWYLNQLTPVHIDPKFQSLILDFN